MRFRNTRLRTKITALLVSLIALWAFAAWVTVRDGVNLLWVSVVNDGVAQPIDVVQSELQQERRLTLSRMVDPRSRNRAALQAQRDRTDKAVGTYQKLATSGNVRLAASSTLRHAIGTSIAQFNGLRTTRSAIDTGLIDRHGAATAYDRAIGSIFEVDDSLATLDDTDFARDVRTLVELNRARELVSQEDALLSAVLASRRFTTTDYVDLMQIVGARKDAFDRVLEELALADRGAYNLAANGDAVLRFLSVERTLVGRSRPGRPLQVSADQWRATADPALEQLSQAVFGGGDRMVERAQPIGLGVIIRLILAGGLGLLAVITSIIVSITTTRALLRQLEKLRNAAHELADRRLPRVVERLGRGENVDVAAEAPPLSFGNDEIGQVGQAFNSVQETAVRTAVEQAELRRGVRDVLLSLARRTQALVHRQLTLLDEMERRRDDAKDLEELFRVDHLATRMRRNAENLIVLSGATPARGWRRPVPMIDIVRSAVAEIEDYTRVAVSPTMDDVSLVGRAVGDIVHLLAELIENAVSFSPPYTQAEVSGRQVARGYAIEIEDRGLGMTDEILASVNDRISDPPEFNLSGSVHLGLYVVGRLAQRYDVLVSLKHSSYGGTTAVVLIPQELLADPAALDAGTRPKVRITAKSLPVAVGGGAGGVAEIEPPVAAPERASFAEPPPDEPPLRHSENGLPIRRRKTGPEQAAAGARTPFAGPATPATTGATWRPGPFTESGSGGDARETMPTDMSHTPHGLPVRVPQASIVPPLRTDGPPARRDEDEVGVGRSPDNVRRSVSGLQAATRRGRAEAAKSRTDPGSDAVPTADEEA